MDYARIIGGFNLTEFFTWIDELYDIHPKMRSQTGVVMPMGCGILHCLSSKQNINAKGSTEAELIGTSEYVPFNVWMVLFLGSQGCKMKKNIIFQ